MITVGNKNIFKLAQDELYSDNFKNLMTDYLNNIQEKDIFVSLSYVTSDVYCCFSLEIMLSAFYDKEAGQYFIGKSNQNKDLVFAFPVEFLTSMMVVESIDVQTLSKEEDIGKKLGIDFIKNNINTVIHNISEHMKYDLQKRYQKQINLSLI